MGRKRETSIDTNHHLAGGYGGTHRGMGSSARSKATARGSFVTLMRRRGCWQRADAQSGGLLDSAMEEIGIVADEYDDEQASDDEHNEGPHVVSPLSGLPPMPYGAHATWVQRRRLKQAEAVTHLFTAFSSAWLSHNTAWVLSQGCRIMPRQRPLVPDGSSWILPLRVPLSSAASCFVSAGSHTVLPLSRLFG